MPKKIFNVTYQQSLKAYELVEQYAAGKDVLDVACGEGYGTSLVGKSASRVVGLDYNKEAVLEAQRRYGSANISFVEGDLFGTNNILQGEQFDIVCCFQTIEHVHDHDEFLAVLTSVVKPGGLLMVSTPNKRLFPSFNPYHVHELDYDEMQALFHKHFSKFTVYGVFGDEIVMQYRTNKQRIADTILSLDVFHTRKWLPQSILRSVYAFVSFFMIKQISLWRHYDDVSKITTANFRVDDSDIQHALDFIVVATKV